MQHQRVLTAIYDYPRGDLADLEVRMALRYYLPGWSIESASTPSFKTLATGFAVAQTALAPLAQRLAPDRFLIYANCAPRKDVDSERTNNEGEGLVYAELNNGVRIAAVNSGYSLSIVKEHIRSLRRINAPADGSQFRSRDNFPIALAEIAAHGAAASVLAEALDPATAIPDIPQGRVGYIDSFGNLKLTMRERDPEFTAFKEGEHVRVKIGQTPRIATVTAGSFNINEGELALAPGSSGYSNRFIELFLRGGSAQAHFDHKAVVEVPVRIERR